MCGDATKSEHVERLLDGAKPDLMVTDPPYGVNYDSSWRYKAGISTKDGAFGKSVNDDTNDWQAAYALFPGSIAYAWMSSLALPVAARGLDACGFVRRSLIIWDKGHIVIGRGHYHWRHESCWHAVKKGAQAHWKGDRKASTLWEIDNPRNSETGHSAQKPVECMQRAIHNHKASYRAIAEKLTAEKASEYADANGVSFERAMKKIPHVSKRTVWDDVTAEYEELRRETEMQRADLMALENARLDQVFSKALSLFANGSVPAGRLAIATMGRRCLFVAGSLPVRVPQRAGVEVRGERFVRVDPRVEEAQLRHVGRGRQR